MDNIIFDKITINNFLSIGNAEVDLSEKGFVVVKGKNEESSTVQSNGSGKSTIFDAIFWTLTGETLRGASDVVNEHRKSEGCSCSLEFHSLSQNYKIVRSRGHKEHGNNCYFFVDEELMSDQIKKSQEMIVKAIPSVSSPEILGSIILLGQGLPYKFSSFSPSKRKDLLETMSGSSTEISKVKTKLDVEESEHFSIINDKKFKISKNEGTVEGLIKTIEILNSQIDSVSSADKVKEVTKEKQKLILDYQSQVDTLSLQLDQNKKSLSTLESVINNVRELLSTYRASLGTINSTISSYASGNCPTCGRPYEVSEESLKQKEVLEQKRASFESEINTLTTKLNNLSSQKSTLESTIKTTETSISSYRYQIGEAQHEVKQLETQLEEISNLKNKVKETEDTINSLKLSIHEDSAIVDKEQEVLDCISYLKRQLSRDFKGYMLSEVIKFMSTRSEYYSNYLFTTGKKIEVTLEGNKILISVGGRLYENLSGGERQRVDLAVQFALRDMLVTTSGFSCNLLVLDEAFDNLDAQGSDALIKLVVSEFSDIDSVFVVTHHSEIDIPYDQQIVVVKDSEGVSHLR